MTDDYCCVRLLTSVADLCCYGACFSWVSAYRDAQSFRFSHYFISYASELTATLAGLGATKLNSDVRW